MDPVLLVIGYTAFTGLTNVIGGVAGRFEHLRRGQFRSSVLHGLVAFGGGTMLAAVALVLLPEGLKSMDAVSAGALPFVGAPVFLLPHEGIERRGGPGGPFGAVGLGFIPGSLALRAAVWAGGG